jgi:hypothetical protein
VAPDTSPFTKPEMETRAFSEDVAVMRLTEDE